MVSFGWKLNHIFYEYELFESGTRVYFFYVQESILNNKYLRIFVSFSSSFSIQLCKNDMPMIYRNRNHNFRFSLKIISSAAEDESS